VRKIAQSLIYLTVLFAAFSCRKDIVLEPKSSYPGEVFIESILYPGEEPKVFLSKSAPFFNKEVTPQELFARGADVRIARGAEVDQLLPDSTFDKFRCRWTPFYKGSIPVVYGQTYELTVRYEGEVYTAATTIDQPKVEIDELEYTPLFYDVYGGHDGLIVRMKDAPGPGNFYRFQMDRWIDTSRYHAHVFDGLVNDCTQGEKFLVSDLGRTIFTDENIDGQAMDLFVEVSFEYREGDEAEVYILSLDEKSAAFFQDLDNQLQSILNPFVEPLFIKSAMEGALGVFGSAVRSDPVHFVYPQDNP
jgi:hypothetical protein